MRSLHVIHRYWPYPGGSEGHLAEIAERLAAEGHETTVLTTEAWDLEAFWDPGAKRVPLREELHQGVAIRRLRLRYLPLGGLAYPALRRAMTGLAYWPGSSRPLLRALARLTPWVPEAPGVLTEMAGRYDVVHAMNLAFEGLAEAAWQAAAAAGKPFALTPLLHLGEGADSSVARRHTMPNQLDLVRRADAVFAQTSLERRFLERMAVKPQRMVAAGVGISPQRLVGGHAEAFVSKFGVDRPIVFYLGAAAYEKGAVHLCRAMELLWRAGERAQLVLAGPVTHAFARFWQRWSRPWSERCRLLGVISEEDKRHLLAAGDVFAMPSRTDSLGVSFLEAWLYGKPVVGARAGGVPEVVRQGETGLLVEFGDVAGLAEALRCLLTDRQEAAQMGWRGREMVLEQYTWEVRYPPVRDTLLRLAAG